MTDIPEFVQRKQDFDRKFTELYLAGYSCSLIAEKMNKTFSVLGNQQKMRRGSSYREDYCRSAANWMHSNRVRLGLPPRKRSGGITRNFIYFQRCKPKRIKKISLSIEKLEKRIIAIQQRIIDLQNEKKQLEGGEKGYGEFKGC